MYVVIGANGYLGSYCIKAILKYTDEYIVATARDIKQVQNHPRVEWMSCDVQLEASIDILLSRIKTEKNIKIVYLAAYHHPDEVHNNKGLAWDINVTCLSRFLNKAFFAEKIFYASTDSVYGESIDRYHFKENDLLNPVNFYGHTKCAAESLLIHLGRNVVRFPFLISPSIIYKPHFYDVIVKSISDGKPIEMYKDSYRSAISFENAGILLVMLMEKKDVPQVLNVCGDKDYSKYDVGCIIAEREGISKELVIPVSINITQKNFLTKRATNTLMDNNLLKNTLNLSYVDIFDYPK